MSSALWAPTERVSFSTFRTSVEQLTSVLGAERGRESTKSKAFGSLPALHCSLQRSL